MEVKGYELGQPKLSQPLSKPMPWGPSPYSQLSLCGSGVLAFLQTVGPPAFPRHLWLAGRGPSAAHVVTSPARDVPSLT